MAYSVDTIARFEPSLPYSAVICGASNSVITCQKNIIIIIKYLIKYDFFQGKTFFLTKLLLQWEQIYHIAPRKVVIVFKMMQPAYKTIQQFYGDKCILTTELNDRLISDEVLGNYQASNYQPAVIVIDDQDKFDLLIFGIFDNYYFSQFSGDTIGDNRTALDLFTCSMHHRYVLF